MIESEGHSKNILKILNAASSENAEKSDQK